MSTTSPKPTVPQVFDRDAASLSPMTLRPVRRDDLLNRALAERGRHEQAAARRQILFLVGEGGIGKSVLLGQLLERLSPVLRSGGPAPSESDQVSPVSVPGAVVLLSCASVGTATTLQTSEQVDDAFGWAVRGQKDRLLSLLNSSLVEHGSVTLLVDTLDLLLSEDSFQAMAQVLAEAVELGEVTVTCRAAEYDAYFGDVRQAAPRLAGRITPFRLPGLSPDEILQWARLYLDGVGRLGEPESDAFFQSLKGGLTRKGTLRDVCSVPVRLALTCDTFSTSGHVSEELTVSDLYDAYWSHRVQRDAGLAQSGRATAKLEAALSLASHVLEADGRLSVRVAKARVGAEHSMGLGLLVSEGVVRDLESSWELFHQTFAEYACARWLLSEGPSGTPMMRFAQHLQAGRSNLWPVAMSVLVRASGSEYDELARLFPLSDPESVASHVLGAIRQATSVPLQDLFGRIAGHENLWPPALFALSSAPSQLTTTAVDICLEALRRNPIGLARDSVATLASLLPRTPAGLTAEYLDRALDELVEVRGFFPGGAWEHLPPILLEGLGDRTALPDVFAQMLRWYPLIGPGGRMSVVRHITIRANVDSEIFAAAETLVRYECPPLDDETARTLMARLWSSPLARTTLGWATWRDVLTAIFPEGWENPKLKFLSWLARNEVPIREQLVDDLLAGDTLTSVSLVNLAKLVAAEHAEWFAGRILARPASDLPRQNMNAIASTVRAIAARLDPTTRNLLIDWLLAGRSAAPRSVWPAQICLAGDDIGRHRTLLSDLRGSDSAIAVVDGAVHAWLVQSPRPVLDALAVELRTMLSSPDSDTQQTRAGLEGRLSDTDLYARNWVEQVVLEGSRPRVAGAALRSIEEAAAGGSVRIDMQMARWLSGLLSTPHVDACMRVARLLHDPVRIADNSFRPITSLVADSAMKRLRLEVLGNGQDQLIRALLETVIRAMREGAGDPALVRDVWDLTASRVLTPGADPAGRSAALRDLAHISGTLLPGLLSPLEGQTRIRRVLQELELDPPRSKSLKAVRSMIIGWSHRDPEALDVLDDVFTVEGVSPHVQMMIAEAMVQRDLGRAARLKDRAECPPEVVTFLLTKLPR